MTVKKTPLKKSVHRLTEMEVEEVSLVDRAANRRKFLVVKRDKKSPVAKDAETVAATVEGIAVFQEHLTALGAWAESVDPDAVTPEQTEAAHELIMTCDQAWENVLNAVVPSMAQPEPEPEEGEEMAPVEGEEPVAANVDPLAKAGAKMSHDRLTRFKQALSSLATIVTEISGEQVEFQTKAKTVKAVAETSDRDDQIVAALSTLAGQITTINKSMHATQSRVSQLAKTRNGGNASPVETPTPDAPSATTWPLDLNKPMDRNSINKSEIFG